MFESTWKSLNFGHNPTHSSALLPILHIFPEESSTGPKAAACRMGGSSDCSMVGNYIS